MPLTAALLKSYTLAFPRITKLAQRVQSSHNLMANYPLTLRQTSKRGHALTSQSRIKKGSDILLLSAQQCLFSSGLAGSSPSEQKQINDQTQLLSQQYDSMNQDYMSRMRIYLQLIANTQTNKHTSMPLRDYAEYVLGGESPGIAKSDINSRFLFELYQSWQVGNRITFGFLKKQLLKRTEQQEFLNACNKGKAIIRSAGDSNFKFAGPFLDRIYHSFTPNCEFDLIYFPHRKSPFVRIKATKDIQAGERPTLSYGALNNYELLLRYGFTVKDNPHQMFMLPLNFEHIIEIFGKNIEWKQAQFLKLGLKLKNYVRILPSGELDPMDLKMMRILINDGHRPTDADADSTELDPLLYRFVGDHAKGLRRNIKINNLKTSSNPFVRQLEEQEVAILEAFISKNGAD